MPTVTAIDVENGTVTLSEDEAYWQSRFEQADEAMARLRERGIVQMYESSPGRWETLQRGSDAFEARIRSYANVINYSPTRRIWSINLAALADTQPVRVAPPFDESWIRANVSSTYSDSCWRNNNCDRCRLFRQEAAEKYDEMYSVLPRETDQWFRKLARMWRNIAIAHTAAYFMLEIHYDGSKFTNEQQILAYVSFNESPTTTPDRAESGGDR